MKAEGNLVRVELMEMADELPKISFYSIKHLRFFRKMAAQECFHNCRGKESNSMFGGKAGYQFCIGFGTLVARELHGNHPAGIPNETKVG